MRAMWRTYGKPGGAREGYVDHPYTLDDVQARLGDVSGDAAFARDFFSRYIAGHDVVDYARLLAAAGLTLHNLGAGHASMGGLQYETRGGHPTITAVVPTGSPAYVAGLERDDAIREVDGERVSSADDIATILRRHKPGDRLDVAFTNRAGQRTTTVTLAESSQFEIVRAESAGGSLTPDQQRFRNAWLGPKPDAP